MEPVDFEPEQLMFLPPHDTVTFAKDQPEYRPLPAVVFNGASARTVSRWTLTAEERQRIANGEDLYIEQLRFRDNTGRPWPLQPILPTVGLRDFCPADAM
jgi:hypothetical protein